MPQSKRPHGSVTIDAQWVKMPYTAVELLAGPRDTCHTLLEDDKIEESLFPCMRRGMTLSRQISAI